MAYRAGAHNAKSPINAIAIRALTITNGSRGCVSYTMLEITFPMAGARVRPTSGPKTSSVAQDEPKHLNGTRANRHADADVLRAGSVLQRRGC
jgi:hypothetical protein